LSYEQTDIRPVSQRGLAKDNQNRTIVYIVVALVVVGSIFLASMGFWGDETVAPPAATEPLTISPPVSNTLQPAQPAPAP
jgi:hypothetical protein